MKSGRKIARSRSPISPLDRGLLYALAIFGGLALIGAVYALSGGARSYDFSVMFFAVQDVWVLAPGFALLLVLKFKPDLFPPIPARLLIMPPSALAALGVAVFALAYAGSFIVMQRHALSIDEFWVLFDAQIMETGRIAASVPAEWRGLADALQPVYRLDTPEGASWVSAYLPLNAALHAVFGYLGDAWLTAPSLAVFTLVMMHAVARQIWPDRRDAAFIAVLLLATSSQFLFTAMTPYAMTAHLALNLLWLWLYLRNTALSHAGALVTGFAATGLHQLVFHPLFAAPFIASLWLRRRWRLAGAYTAVYAAICLFWVLYTGSLASPGEPKLDGQVSDFLAKIGVLWSLPDPGILMMNNLGRLIAWQNPLALILLVMAFINVRSWRSPMPELLCGIVLMLGLAFVLIPSQGYGWGYRYVHGMLGSISVLAACGWVLAVRPRASSGRSVLAACTAFAILVLPVRAWQAHAFVKPYASLIGAAKATHADVIIVDPADIWYGAHLLRNDPFLRTTPMVLLNRLDEFEIRRLCEQHRIAILDSTSAAHFGVRVVEPDTFGGNSQYNTDMRALLSRIGCGASIIGRKP